MKTERIYEIFREESTGISIDSRSIKKGQLFFALWGQNHNGNKYAAEALEKGASYAIIDDPAFENDRTILVDDCLNELQAIASHHRKETRALVLAITGTNGKTTTKELIAAIMAKKFKVHYTKGNLNNEIGLPLTILSAPEGTEIMVLEMGANHLGEIRTLCLIARPDYGIITNVGTAHIEGFGSADGVLKAKTELYEYLRKVNGVALYNDRDPLLAERIFRIVNRAVPFSNPSGAELKVEPIPSDLNLCIRVQYKQRVFEIPTKLFGTYNLENLRASIATGLFLGVDIDDIAEAVGNYNPGNNRSEVKTTRTNTLICDSYNANPTSMLLAIGSFSQIKSDEKALILGDMLELGEKSDEEHKRILSLLRSLNIGKVYLVGQAFSKASKGSDFLSFQDVGKLADYLKIKPLKKSTILIKGSRKMTLEKIYEFL
jgi:UDP-N-acetylmuramoyl-tripeptide--D-alanyl-D-alanine ligase